MPTRAEDVDPKALINPSSGLLARNPSHIGIAETAEDQSDIVRAIKGAGRHKELAHLTYEDKDNLPMFPGILRIREMAPEQVENFCKNLMRARPNIFRIHIKLGEYPSNSEIRTKDIEKLSSHQPRHHIDVGEAISKVLCDPNNRIVELNYLVTNTTPGQFNAEGRAAAATEEEYKNDKFFKPEIIIEYFPNN